MLTSQQLVYVYTVVKYTYLGLGLVDDHIIVSTTYTYKGRNINTFDDKEIHTNMCKTQAGR